MTKVKIENYQIYIDGQPLKKVKNLAKPIEKQREDKTHYFRKKNWKKSRGEAGVKK